VEKHGTARQATDDNTARALCMLDSYGYRQTLGKCKTYCFSMATIVSERASVLDYRYIACLVDTKFMHSSPMQPICFYGRYLDVRPV